MILTSTCFVIFPDEDEIPVPEEPAAILHFTIALNIKAPIEYEEFPKEPVQDDILKQWREKGRNPCKTGIAKVKHGDSEKEYTYPLYFNR